MNYKTIIYGILGAIIVAGGIVFAMHKSEEPAPNNTTAEEQEVRDAVAEFGSRMKYVSVLSGTAAEDIQKQYKELVSAEIMEGWQKNPASAPGRRTATSWPDRIEIQELTTQEDGAYNMQGTIIEVTDSEEATGAAAVHYQLALRLRKVEGTWIITGYQSIVPVQ